MKKIFVFVFWLSVLALVIDGCSPTTTTAHELNVVTTNESPIQVDTTSLQASKPIAPSLVQVWFDACGNSRDVLVETFGVPSKARSSIVDRQIVNWTWSEPPAPIRLTFLESSNKDKRITYIESMVDMTIGELASMLDVSSARFFLSSPETSDLKEFGMLAKRASDGAEVRIYATSKSGDVAIDRPTLNEQGKLRENLVGNPGFNWRTASIRTVCIGKRGQDYNMDYLDERRRKTAHELRF